LVGIRIVKRVKTIAAALSELEVLAARYDVEVTSSKENALCFNDEGEPYLITYSGNLKPRTRLWALVHELGHLIALYNYRPQLAKKFEYAPPGSFWQLEDEMQAWGIADLILHQLNPSFYEENYIKWKHERLKTYYRN
jgi:hypothetical protein